MNHQNPIYCVEQYMYTVPIANDFPIFAGLAHALFAKFFIWTNQKRVVPLHDSRQIILLIWPAIIYACQRRDILANTFTTKRGA